MKEYTRKNPLLSLCGLSCGLCPQFHSGGVSRCPGCGGEDFHLKHPSCAVITCAKNHGNPEYCSNCPDYPCPRYENAGAEDSFITYRNVLRDLGRVKEGGENSLTEALTRKTELVRCFIEQYDDGRSKSFFCLAANLLELDDLEAVAAEMRDTPNSDKAVQNQLVRQLLKSAAARNNIELKLRRKKK